MIKSNYIRSTKITPRLKQFIVDGEHITIEGDKFEKITKTPYGRTIFKNLIKEDKSERITCYV